MAQKIPGGHTGMGGWPQTGSYISVHGSFVSGLALVDEEELNFLERNSSPQDERIRAVRMSRSFFILIISVVLRLNLSLSRRVCFEFKRV